MASVVIDYQLVDSAVIDTVITRLCLDRKFEMLVDLLKYYARSRGLYHVKSIELKWCHAAQWLFSLVGMPISHLLPNNIHWQSFRLRIRRGGPLSSMCLITCEKSPWWIGLILFERGERTNKKTTASLPRSGKWPMLNCTWDIWIKKWRRELSFSSSCPALNYA